MLHPMKSAMAVCLLATACTAAGNGSAHQQSAQEPQIAAEFEQDQTVQFLLLVETEKDGTISRQEWLKRMEEEFDRVDTDKDGVLDGREIAEAKLPVVHPRILNK